MESSERAHNMPGPVQYQGDADNGAKGLGVPRPMDNDLRLREPRPFALRAGRVLRGFRPRCARTASRPSARSAGRRERAIFLLACR